MPIPKELKPVGDTGNTDEDEYESKYGATLLTKSSDLTSITPMPKKLKLLKTCSMLFVYCGLVSIKLYCIMLQVYHHQSLCVGVKKGKIFMCWVAIYK